MATWDDVSRLALELPETSEGRLARPAPLARQGQGLRLGATAAPSRATKRSATRRRSGPILGARVEHLVAKEALLADDPSIYFTTPHFDGYPAVLVRLDRIGLADLHELIVEAWLARAPKRLVSAFLEESAPLGRAVADGLDVVAVRVEHERAVVVRVVDLPDAGLAVVAPPAASAASWKASTVSRSSAANATCTPLSGPRSRCAIQKNGKSSPNPPPLDRLHHQPHPQGRERPVVEGLARLVVVHIQSDVIKSGCHV